MMLKGDKNYCLASVNNMEIFKFSAVQIDTNANMKKCLIMNKTMEE